MKSKEGDLERAERLVQKCIEVRGVKVKCRCSVPSLRIGVRGEVVRKTDMRVEFGGRAHVLRISAHGASGCNCGCRVEIVGLLSKRSHRRFHGHGYRDRRSRAADAAGFRAGARAQIHYLSTAASGIQHIVSVTSPGSESLTTQRIRIQPGALRENPARTLQD